MKLVDNFLHHKGDCLRSVSISGFRSDLNEMSEIPFRGQLPNLSRYDEKNSRYFSELKINSEWNLLCFGAQYDQSEPEFLIFRRLSSAKEILVSGTFKLMRGELSVSQQKFKQLIEAGVKTIQIELNINDTRYPHVFGNNAYQQLPTAYARNYSIAGTLMISANTECAPEQTECAKGVQFNSLLDLSNDFECLLDPKATYFSDVIVNCGTVSFSAHKNILCARSPVFAAMFTTRMKENQNNKVDITDLSPRVFKTMLNYIYSGKTGELSAQTAAELLFAADKYQLLDLVRVCGNYLKSCMSAENALRTLVLGYLHDQDLKVFAMDFICNSCKEFEVLENTVEWKNLQEKIPSLAMEVLISLVKSKDKKLKRYQ